MAANDGPRETILRDAKYDKIARSISYAPVQIAVARFLSSPTRDRKILIAARDAIERNRDNSIEAKERNKYELQVAALDAFERQLNQIGLAGINAELPSYRPHITEIESVKISVFPSVWLLRRRQRGADQSGAAIFDFAKGKPIRTDAAKAKASDAMRYTAYILHMHVSEHRCPAGIKPCAELCFVHHLHRSEGIYATESYKREIRNMEAVCKGIAQRWDVIEPPEDFDPKQARFRH